MRTTLFLAMAVVALALTAAPAHADLVLLLDDGLTQSANTLDWDKVIIDGGSAGDASVGGNPGGNWTATTGDIDATDGIVSFYGTVGGFNVSMTTGVSSPVIGPNRLDLFSLNISGDVGGSISIMLIDTDYLAPPLESYLNFEGGGTTDGTVRMRSGYSADNNEGGFTFLTDTTESGGAFSYSDTVPVDLDGPFSMVLLVQITHQPVANAQLGGAVTSLDAIVQIPEPATAMLVLLGLGGLALRRRRRA
jgi:hypothetical protein